MMTTQAMAMKVAHAILTVETQGMLQFLDYTSRIEKDAKDKKKGSRANKWLVSNSDWKIAQKIANSNPTDHPKLERLLELIEVQIHSGSSRFIIFAEIRHTAKLIVEHLEKVEGAKPVRFVGQGSRVGDKGMTQKQQKKIFVRCEVCASELLVVPLPDVTSPDVGSALLVVPRAVGSHRRNVFVRCASLCI